MADESGYIRHIKEEQTDDVVKKEAETDDPTTRGVDDVMEEPKLDPSAQTGCRDLIAAGTSGYTKYPEEECIQRVIKEEVIYIKQEPIEDADEEKIDTDDALLDSSLSNGSHVNSEPETDVIAQGGERFWLKGGELTGPCGHVDNSAEELEKKGIVISNTLKKNLLRDPNESDTCKSSSEWKAELGVNVSRPTVVEPHVCDVCKCSFGKACQLKSHMRIHTGERPFDCDVCGSKFSQAGHLKEHQRIHTGEKPYICDVCNSGFRLAANLKRHERIHSREKPYACDVCESRFSQANDLKRHKSIHRGEKPYVCDECESRFSRVSHLKRHKRIHTGEKPYVCDVCDSRFSRVGVLKNHKRIHSREKARACDTVEPA